MKKILFAATCLFALAATSCSDEKADLFDFTQGGVERQTVTPANAEVEYASDNTWANTYKGDQLQLGSLIFSHDGYVSSYGGYWDGFTASKNFGTPAVTADNWMQNQFYSCTGTGANGNQPYLVAYASEYSANYPACNITNEDGLFAPQSVSITNFAYMPVVLTQGDAYSRKFENGDYCVLHIYGVSVANDMRGPVDVYLADFRDGKTEILKEWKTVDLSSLGTVKQVAFSIESTDVGTWGINTPTYFCLDNFVCVK